MKPVNDVIRFCVEIATLVLIIKVSFHFTGVYKLILMIAIPLILLYWGRYMAPNSLHRLPEIGRIVSEVVIFGGTSTLLYISNYEVTAILFLVISSINTILDHIL